MINNIKISELPELTSPTSSGYTVIADGYTTYKISLQTLLSNIGSLTLTTTGSTGPASYDSVLNTLNIPIYESESVSGVYFVDKRYEGVAGAVVTGLTLSSISSSNDSYNEQLNNAVRGSSSSPFPCPISARNRAMDDLENGDIDFATIIVLQGNWTVGSDNPGLNGTVDGTTADADVTADLGFSASNNSTVASLIQNKVNYWFYHGTQLTYINSSYTLYHNYLNDNTDTEFSSEILGYLAVEMVYGNKNPIASQNFACRAIYLSNTRATVNFQYESFKMRPWEFIEAKTLKSLNVKIKDFEGVDCVPFDVRLHKESPDNSVSYNLEIENLLIKLNTTDNDFWGCFAFEGNNVFLNSTSTGTTSNYNVKIKNANVTQSHGLYDGFIMSGGLVPYNTNFNVQIDNLTHKSGNTLRADQSLISLPYLRTRNFNGNIKFGNVVSDIPLLREVDTYTLDSSGAYSNEENIKINIHVDQFVKIQNSAQNAYNVSNKYCLYLVESNYLSSLGGGMVNIKGNFTTDDVVMYTRHIYTSETGNTNIIRIGGVLRTTGTGKNVVVIDRKSTNPFLSFVDAFLVNDNTVSTIVNGSLLPLQAQTIYFKNVGASSDVDTSHITKVGDSITITSNLNKFIR
jgi:hypothetical protein